MAEKLQLRIREGIWQPGDRIPNEDEIAAEFVVSRSTVREALLYLEQIGLISRQHGVGSFVSPYPNAVLASLEHLESFTESIRASGRAADEILLSVTEEGANAEVARGLGIAPGDPVARIEALRRADAQPVIYGNDYFPRSLVPDLDTLARERSRQSLMEMCTERLHRSVKYALLTLNVGLTDPVSARHLQVAEGFPVLILEGPAFDLKNTPLYFSTYHIRTDTYKFTVIRH